MAGKRISRKARRLAEKVKEQLLKEAREQAKAEAVREENIREDNQRREDRRWEGVHEFSEYSEGAF